MAKTLLRIPPVLRVTKFEVVKDEKHNRFFYKGFVFDRIYAGCFESEVTDHEVQVSVYRKVAKCQDGKIVDMVLAFCENWYVTHHDGPDDSHCLSKKVRGTLTPVGPYLDVSLFKTGDVVVVAGHKDRINRKYLKERAEY